MSAMSALSSIADIDRRLCHAMAHFLRRNMRRESEPYGWGYGRKPVLFDYHWHHNVFVYCNVGLVKRTISALAVAPLKGPAEESAKRLSTHTGCSIVVVNLERNSAGREDPTLIDPLGATSG